MSEMHFICDHYVAWYHRAFCICVRCILWFKPSPQTQYLPPVLPESGVAGSWVTCWPRTPTAFWESAFSITGARKGTRANGREQYSTGLVWTLLFSWWSMTALTASTASSCSRTRGCRTCRCCRKKLVSYLASFVICDSQFATVGLQASVILTFTLFLLLWPCLHSKQ